VSVFLNGNSITLLKGGEEYFPALLAELEAAKREIHLEIYIFEDDSTGREVAAALVRAALRGVPTHLLVDGFGSHGIDRSLIEEMEEAGVRFLVYRPQVSPWKLRHSRLRRMHRKLAVIDARVAFVGGINVDDTVPPGGTAPRFDFAVRVEGPLLAVIYPLVKRLWTLVNATRLRARLPDAPRLVPSKQVRGGQRAAFVVRDNIGHRRDIEEAYLAAFESARREILIANAYFFPGQTFRRALTEAAARGVRVMLLLQGKVEYVLQHYASRALYGSFRDAGIEIHEYHKSYLHAKVAVVDCCWSTVGSSNIDPFSLLLAREANVVIDDEGFAGELRAGLLAAIADGATQVRRESWAAEPLAVRTMTWLSYGLARFLTGVFAYGRAKEFT
jgi:cardiolipin synthase A/B